MARRYARDNRGRFASVGATARGGRLRTAAGNKRATVTTKISGGRSGVVGKPKGLKPGVAKVKAVVSRPDTAQANVPMRGARGKALEASIDRAVKQVKAIQTAQLMKPKAQIKAERAARAEAKKAADAAKPNRTRTAKSLRVSRAKQVEKRREMNIDNPAAWRQDSAGRMAVNAARTQKRALAFYKSGGKSKAVKSQR